MNRSRVVVCFGIFLLGCFVGSIATAIAINGTGVRIGRSDTVMERRNWGDRTIITFSPDPYTVQSIWIASMKDGETGEPRGFYCQFRYDQTGYFYDIPLDRPAEFKGVVINLSPLREEKDVWVDSYDNRYRLVNGSPPEKGLYRHTVECHWNPTDRSIYIVDGDTTWRRER